MSPNSRNGSRSVTKGRAQVLTLACKQGTRNRRLGRNLIEDVKGAHRHLVMAGRPGVSEAPAVFDCFVVEQVQGADPDPGGRQIREIGLPCRNGDFGIGPIEVPLSRAVVVAVVPHDSTTAVRNHPGPIVKHGIHQHLQIQAVSPRDHGLTEPTPQPARHRHSPHRSQFVTNRPTAGAPTTRAPSSSPPTALERHAPAPTGGRRPRRRCR